MMLSLEKLKKKVTEISERGTERSLYPAICEFITDFAREEKHRDFSAVPEESLKQQESKIGFPDITVRDQKRLVGWIEVKLSSCSLKDSRFETQFDKYRESLENIIFTNLREWELWVWDEKGEPKKEMELIFDVTDYSIGAENKLKNLLLGFFDGRPYETKTPKQLALALAKKTRLLSRQVEESFGESEVDSDLRKLKDTFEKTLIQNIDEHQFANMVAETMAYSLFLACLEHSERDSKAEFSLETAIRYLPTNVPILRDLYDLIKKVAGTIPIIYKATQLLVDQLNASAIGRIHQKLVEHKPGEDPVIQFYEPFLKEYDPKEREARGVYYTPKPVVDYIVKGVDWILRNKFKKTNGLADESVHLLDPATGTGTFLMSAIQEIYANIKNENSSLGDEMVKREFNRVVLTHILKHFYGFELLIAPYAIAHLKLTLEVERLGFDFANTKSDADKDNDRFKVYLANTLDDPDSKSTQGEATSDFGSMAFPAIPEESEAARKVKKNVPILAIIGNPPYSGTSQNAGVWIQGLLKDAYYNIEGVSLGEKNPKWLQDDYVKFIRFAEWKIRKEGCGVISMITNHGYINNPTFRGMRYHLMKTFDEIYVLDLHGNYLKKEKAPDGSQDENIFNIKVGTAICFFIKYPNQLKEKKIYFAELWGSRVSKFNVLLKANFNDIKWKTINPQADSYVLNDKQPDKAYSRYEKITDAFSLNSIGFVTSKDDFLLDFNKNQLTTRIKSFMREQSEENIKSLFNLRQTIPWIKLHRNKFLENKQWENEILLSTYRPFDNRYVLYADELIERSRKEVLQHMKEPNLALLCKRQSKQRFSYIFVSNMICESCVFESAYANNSVLPLYVYRGGSQSSLLGQEDRVPNLSQDFIEVFSKKLGLKFISNGKGDLGRTFGPESIFYYTYAIFHAPSYRSLYAEPLKSDFPRLPLTSDKKLFVKLVALGSELVNLHLLGENPFDKSKNVFDDNSKWRVKPVTEKRPDVDWKVGDVRFDGKNQRVYVNDGQYFEGVEKEVWEFMIGGYQVCEKWLKDRKKAERSLSTDDIKHYIKMVVALRETIRIMKEIDETIPAWPIK